MRRRKRSQQQIEIKKTQDEYDHLYHNVRLLMKAV